MSRRIIYLLVAEVLLGCVAVGLRAQTPERRASSTPAAPPSATGQALYSSRCAGCHGLDGKGGEHGPNIATNPDIRRLPDAQIQRIIRNGIPASGMPAFGSTFNAAQIAAVLDHLRVLQGGHKQMPISGDAQKGNSFSSEKPSAPSAIWSQERAGSWELIYLATARRTQRMKFARR